MQRLFLTESGDPVSAVTASEAVQLIRAREQRGAPGLAEIVESGGRSAYILTRRIIADLPQTGMDEIVLLGGPGYTGAAGLSLARHLANHGLRVTVFFPLTSMRAVTARQLEAVRNSGVPVATHLNDLPQHPAMIVDAMMGISGAPMKWDDLSRVCAWVNTCRSSGATVLSLESPSGVDPTTGIASSGAITADDTLCMAFPKTGLQAPECGRIAVADVGIPPETYRRVAIVTYPCVFTDSFILALQSLA